MNFISQRNYWKYEQTNRNNIDREADWCQIENFITAGLADTLIRDAVKYNE